MPTYERSDEFKSDYRGLTEAERALVREALGWFIDDLKDIEAGILADFRSELRVKKMRRCPGIWEMTWEKKDGRATFEFGAPVKDDLRHVRWRRLGGHVIFSAP